MLGSKVARRTFGAFFACSLLPMLAFAWWGHSAIGQGLVERAKSDLRRDAKAAGIALMEALRVRAVAAGSSAATAAAPLPSSIALDARQREQLARGRPFVVPLNARPDGSAALGIVRAPGGSPELARVEVELAVPELFASDALADHFTRGAVLFDRSVLYSTLERDLPRSEFERARAQQGQSGTLDTGAGDAARVLAWWTLFAVAEFGAEFVIVQERDRADVLEPVASMRNAFLLLVGLALALSTYLCLLHVRRALRPIAALRAGTERIARGDLATVVAVASGDEFQDLADSFNSMAADLERRVRMLSELNGVGVALSIERDEGGLVRTVAGASLRILEADGVAIFAGGDGSAQRLLAFDASARLLPDDGDAVQQRQGWLEEHGPLLGDVASRAVEHAGVVECCIEADGAHGAGALSALSIPMRDHESETIGVLQVFRLARADGTGGFAPDQRAVAESLASQAAVAITKNRLAGEFRALFDSLAELIATAIDEKSPYTGGHCRRVPVITMMLAEAVRSEASGRFERCRLSDDEMYELRVAALLHDCGKVATPVHIVDKATKLEKIVDRIEQVALAFEVVRRDARAVGDEALLGTIDDDLAFIRRCNVGAEFMSPAEQQRVRDIAGRYEFTDAKGEVRSVLGPDEVENLVISRGTLNHADREIINQHVVSTIHMLEQLPYPRRLRNVPRIAGAHHERLDGKGYPNQLRAEQISLQGRILALADVFEALTAKDRPYKPGKKLSETMRILDAMALEGHIDPELFRLFVERRLYESYAREYLDLAQIDAVDVEKLKAFGAGRPELRGDAPYRPATAPSGRP